MAMLERAGERGDPRLITLGAAVAAAQHLHAEDADQVDRKPQRKAGIALFAEHLEIGAVIGARLVHLERLVDGMLRALTRSEEHTAELQSLMSKSYAVF